MKIVDFPIDTALGWYRKFTDLLTDLVILFLLANVLQTCSDLGGLS